LSAYWRLAPSLELSNKNVVFLLTQRTRDFCFGIVQLRTNKLHYTSVAYVVKKADYPSDALIEDR